MLRAVAAASPGTTIAAGTKTTAKKPPTMTIRYRPPATLAQRRGGSAILFLHGYPSRNTSPRSRVPRTLRRRAGSPCLVPPITDQQSYASYAWPARLDRADAMTYRVTGQDDIDGEVS